jgi:hypothetical protein
VRRRRAAAHVVLGAVALLGTATCGRERTSGAAAARVPRTLRVTILGDVSDSRLSAVRAALGYWNGEAARLGLGVRLDSGTLVRTPVPDDVLLAAGRAMPWGGPGVLRLRATLAQVPGDVVIALAHGEIVSFGVSAGTGRTGIIGLRPADRWPLSLPNTMRNVAAHELGHVLGLSHNADAATLMCGRPAPCRPTAFASERARFFPLTPADEHRLRQRWR